MKRILAATVLALAVSASFAQVQVTGYSTSRKAPARPAEPKEYETLGAGKFAALYDYKINTTDKEGAPVSELYATALRIGDNGAIFTDYITFSADSLMAAGAPQQQVDESRAREEKTQNFFVPVIAQNIPEGKTTVTDISAITVATYEEPFADIEWTLTEETDTMAGYNIAKATGSYGGRDWVVWYTEEIPAAYGPWKLAGLPGLVLKAADTEGIHEFKLISFTKSDVPLLRLKDKRAVKTDRAKFVEIKNSQAQKPMKAINPSMITDMAVNANSGSWGQFKINGVQIRTPVNIYQPLELK